MCEACYPWRLPEANSTPAEQISDCGRRKAGNSALRIADYESRICRRYGLDGSYSDRTAAGDVVARLLHFFDALHRVLVCYRRDVCGCGCCACWAVRRPRSVRVWSVNCP